MARADQTSVYGVYRNASRVMTTPPTKGTDENVFLWTLPEPSRRRGGGLLRATAMTCIQLPYGRCSFSSYTSSDREGAEHGSAHNAHHVHPSWPPPLLVPPLVRYTPTKAHLVVALNDQCGFRELIRLRTMWPRESSENLTRVYRGAPQKNSITRLSENSQLL